MNTDSTICAISTAAGTGGIAVIRVSGKDAIDITSKVWQGKPIGQMPSHTAHLGRIVGPDGYVVDEVVLTLFRSPRSFTGDDTIEISCHGSVWIQQQIINLLISAGCRMATGGEFTQRAFLNGRLDLSQAEAIADLIASSSQAAHRIAFSQMRGQFSHRLAQLREQLLEFVSLMELELDFSEEEVEFADRSRLLALATDIHTEISRLEQSFAVGNAIKNGIPVAIVGETNVGKSTLLNTLLHDDRALVSDIHGTTRDVIEDTIVIAGTLFRLIDTAGIRTTSDVVESMGIERTFRKLDQASIVLWLIDATAPTDEIHTTFTRIANATTDTTRIVPIINKADLATANQLTAAADAIASHLPQAQSLQISAKSAIGIDTLQQRICALAALPQNDANEVIVTNARHYAALRSARQAIERAIDGLRNGLSGDFVSQDIRETMHYLGEITGEITPNDILGTIFSHFCIGK